MLPDHLPERRTDLPGENLEKCGLSRSVASNDSPFFRLGNSEGDISKESCRPELNTEVRRSDLGQARAAASQAARQRRRVAGE